MRYIYYYCPTAWRTDLEKPISITQNIRVDFDWMRLIQIFIFVLCVTINSLGFPRVSRDFTFLTLDFTFLTLDFTFLTPQWCEQENEFDQTTTSWDVLCRSGSNFNFSKYKYPFESDETFLSKYGSHAYTEKPSFRAGRQPEQALEVSRWAWVPCLVKKVPSDSKWYLYFEKLKLEPDRYNTSHDVVVWSNSFSCSHHCGVKM